MSPLLLLFIIATAKSATIYDLNLSNLPSSQSFQAAIVAGLWNKQIRQKQDGDIGKYDTIHLNRNPEDPAWLQTALDYYLQMASSAPPKVTQTSLDTIINLSINHSIIQNRILFNISQSYSIPTLILLCNEYSALPVLNESSYNSHNLPIIYSTVNKWANEYDATVFGFDRYLNTSNPPIPLNKTIMALQKPDLLTQGFLTDFVISDNLFILWMDDLCLLYDSENILLNDIVYSPYYTTEQSIGLSIMGYYPSDEVLCTCVRQHSTISFVSDFVISLSFHELLPKIPNSHMLSQIAYDANMTYSSDKKYLALIQSDGDNIQLDMNGLRPRMEERISLCSAANRSQNVCPVFGWTISNRLMDIAPHIIYWFYNVSMQQTRVDSFLMGPSGYGYLYPSVIRPESLRDEFVEMTIFDGYWAGQMRGFVYWDYESTQSEMNKYILKFDNFNYSSLNITDASFKFNGVFSDSPFLSEYIGDDIVTFKMADSWHNGQSPQSVAKGLNAKLKPGSLSYLYKIWDVSFTEVEEMVKLLNDDIILVDYREMIVLAEQKKKI